MRAFATEDTYDLFKIISLIGPEFVTCEVEEPSVIQPTLSAFGKNENYWDNSGFMLPLLYSLHKMTKDC